MEFRGKLLQGSQTVLDDLAGELLYQTDPDGIRGWSGSFVVPVGKQVEPGRYRLTLDDGRNMDILVDRVGPPGGPVTVAHFRTSGTIEMRLPR
ncbi:MAG TPA: hypothetical protein VNK04_25480 [Gemmataceae bacterium]|nr:hypothetical protein [Gemmataceae bacterium]